MAVSIRTLSGSDLETANAILQSAFQRTENWLPELRLFRRLQPEGTFLASVNGIPAGMVATILYSNYAYVGLMGVHQDFQGQGLGIALMEHVLTWTSERKITLVKLDASPFGQPLYEKLGFVLLDEVYVLESQANPLNSQHLDGIQLMAPHHLDLLAVSDTQTFGTDRSRLLRALLEIYPERAFIAISKQEQISGYLFAQAKRIGPWIMNETGDAETLLLTALSLPFNVSVSVVTPANNTGAVSLLQRYGFQIVRVNRHMAYGPYTAIGQREQVYGQTSLSFG